MDYDVVIVGGGPAGLAAAIRLKQLSANAASEFKVCVVEKGAEIGSHILSGNVFEPRSLNELIPDWKEKGAPLETPVTKDQVFLLTKTRGISLPTPPSLQNHGNYIISLGDLCKWLAQQAEELGVEIYPGFAASEVLYNERGAVAGIATGDMGVGKDGKPTSNFQRGMELRAKQTLFAEGCRGSLSEQVMKKYNLRKGRDPQTYGLGIKEVWELDPSVHEAGKVTHTLGWPLSDPTTWMGTFAYHMKPNLLHIGMVVGLDYENPYLSPYQEFQRWKHHPKVAPLFKGAKIVSYGARALNEGGVQSMPKLTFPGGALIGASAGFMNVPKIKGSHTAMKSGMLAADSIYARHQQGEQKNGQEALDSVEVGEYEKALRESWVYKELHAVRNVHPSLKKMSFLPWLAYSGLESFLLKGRTPWTFHHHQEDWQATKPLKRYEPIDYPKPDGEISFDILTNLQRSGTQHEEDQPVHLKIKPELKDAPYEGFIKYGGPEQRFCPAKVYEWLDVEAGKPRLQINAANCVHCKTCDIKPYKNFIQWTTPEGGGGPKYAGM